MLASVTTRARGVRSRVDAGTAAREGESGRAAAAGDPQRATTPQPAGGDTPADPETRRRLFVVSVSEDESGAVHGVVEAVRTGRKERFQGVDTLGAVVGALFRRLREEDIGRVRCRSGAGIVS